MNHDFTTPPTPVTAPVAARDRRTARLARVGLLGIASAALISVAMLAFGSTFAPTRTLAGTGSGDGSTENVEAFGLRGPFGRGHGVMFGGITVAAISGNEISLETEDGWTRTITVDQDTEYSRSGDEIALGDLAVGDSIAFRQTLEDDGAWTIDAIAVILPHVAGEVTAVDGSTITVERRGGEAATITVNGETEYRVNGDDATLADLQVGMVLIAEGTENADGSITATEVRAADPDELGGWRGLPPGNGPGFGPGRHGFGFGIEPHLDRDGDTSAATADPEADGSAS